MSNLKTPRGVTTVQPGAENRRARRHPDPPGRRWASIRETAEYLDVTTRTIRQMITDGRLTGHRNGTRIVRVDLNELDAAMQPYGGDAA